MQDLGYNLFMIRLSLCVCVGQVWNHPWVLKLDEDRRFEREERRRLYEESEEDSLDGFIVTGSEEEEEERGRRRKNKESKVRVSHFLYCAIILSCILYE